MPRIQLMSAPAENDAPAPVSTTQRTLASSSQSTQRRGELGDQLRRRTRCVRCGRLSVIVGDGAAAGDEDGFAHGRFSWVGWNDSESGVGGCFRL